MLVVAWEVHRNPVQQTDMYRAIKVDECQFPRKCGFCGLSVSLEGAPSIRGSVCADQVRPRPVAGDALAVDGHYFSGGVYVTGIRNIGGATAPSAP